MGCSLYDDCAECPHGGVFDCDGWDSSRHESDYEDDEYYYDDDDDDSFDYLYLPFEDNINNDDFDTENMNANTLQYCANCGTPTQLDWNYCIACGTELLKKYCVRCGKKVAESWETCPHCESSIPDRASLTSVETSKTASYTGEDDFTASYHSYERYDTIEESSSTYIPPIQSKYDEDDIPF